MSAISLIMLSESEIKGVNYRFKSVGQALVLGEYNIISVLACYIFYVYMSHS